ncbi:MAG: hypothetical protein DCF19_18430 [Pseudanabaena frigida]|uniref:Uncharacterized protein n=1 Tax=Pseudanabaena frigida TaxID=945775 RepID=A0A2W4XQ15_9CYAN|nr:MAG: hypothetical protein DCF19_18430 [Pseudanabaena frigida]
MISKLLKRITRGTVKSASKSVKTAKVLPRKVSKTLNQTNEIVTASILLVIVGMKYGGYEG